MLLMFELIVVDTDPREFRIWPSPPGRQIEIGLVMLGSRPSVVLMSEFMAKCTLEASLAVDARVDHGAGQEHDGHNQRQDEAEQVTQDGNEGHDDAGEVHQVPAPWLIEASHDDDAQQCDDCESQDHTEEHQKGDLDIRKDGFGGAEEAADRPVHTLEDSGEVSHTVLGSSDVTHDGA